MTKYMVTGSVCCLIEAESRNDALRLMVDAMMSLENCEGVLDWDDLSVGTPVETKQEDFSL